MRKRPAWTLVECLISLFVLSLMIVIVQVILPGMDHLQNDSLKNTTDWYLFIQRLEDPKYQFQLRSSGTQRLFLYSERMKEEYQVQSGRSAIYLRTSQGGYLPVLVNYQPGSIRFVQLDTKSVMVKGQLANGERKGAIIHFQKAR